LTKDTFAKPRRSLSAIGASHTIIDLHRGLAFEDSFRLHRQHLPLPDRGSRTPENGP